MNPFRRSSRSRDFEDYTQQQRSSRPSSSRQHGPPVSYREPGMFSGYSLGSSSSSRRRSSLNGVGPSDSSRHSPPASFLRGASTRHLFSGSSGGSHPSSHSSRRPSIYDNLEPPTRRASLSRRNAVNEYSDPDPFYTELSRRPSRRATNYDDHELPTYRSASSYARSSQHHSPAYNSTREYSGYSHGVHPPSYSSYSGPSGSHSQYPPTRRPSHYGGDPLLDRDHFIRKWDR